MSLSGMPHWGRRHAVTTPGLDREGIETVARFIADGWAASERGLVVTTSAHQRRIDGALRRWGHDPDELRRQSRYTCVDADALIAQATTEGEFDADLFGRLASDLLVSAGAGGCRVRAFGEVVARLWQHDQVAAALDVERQWHALLREHDFTLLSASATITFGRSTLLDVRRICDLHAELDGGEDLPLDLPLDLPPDLRLTAPLDLSGLGRHPDHACSRVFPPAPESVPAARHFVVEVLGVWGDGHLLADAAIIASELATNALLHARSPFRVVLDRRANCVRLGVEDGARQSPNRRAVGSDDLDGRGVALIEALSQRWGSSATLTGKVVWAEVVRSPVSASPPRARWSPRAARSPARGSRPVSAAEAG